MNKNCGCKDWWENEPIINAPYRMNLSVVGEYSGKKFEFCPWCGNKLKSEASQQTVEAYECKCPDKDICDWYYCGKCNYDPS